MMPSSSDPPLSYDHLLNEKDDLVFLRNEGLEFLALFKSIKDPAKRQLIMDLIRIIAEGQRQG